MTAWRAWLRARTWACGVAAAALSACASAPQAPAPRAEAAPVASPTTGGEVIGRSERYIVYVPVAGDTLRSIAARYLGGPDRDWMIGDFNGIVRAEPGQALVLPLKPHNLVGVQSGGMQTVPILCYHRFGAGVGLSGGSLSGKMSVATANFAAQLDWLARNDYRVIRLEQLLGFLEGRQALPRRSVVITIDDGYESVYRHALPQLRRFGFPATLFVYTDFIGAGDALSWSQLAEMEGSGLIDVQAHSKSHRNLIERFAGEGDERYQQSLDAEIRQVRDLLERRLATPVRHFAFPYGDANEAVLQVLTRQRYQMAVTVNPGGNAFYAQPLFLRRTMIFGDDDLEDFKTKLQTSRSWGAGTGMAATAP